MRQTEGRSRRCPAFKCLSHKLDSLSDVIGRQTETDRYFKTRHAVFSFLHKKQETRNKKSNASTFLFLFLRREEELRVCACQIFFFFFLFFECQKETVRTFDMYVPSPAQLFPVSVLRFSTRINLQFLLFVKLFLVREGQCSASRMSCRFSMLVIETVHYRS